VQLGQPGTERPAEAKEGEAAACGGTARPGSEGGRAEAREQVRGTKSFANAPGDLRAPAAGTRWPGARGEPVDVLRAAGEPPPPREEECTGRAAAGRARRCWRCWPRCCWPRAGRLPKVRGARAPGGQPSCRARAAGGGRRCLAPEPRSRLGYTLRRVPGRPAPVVTADRKRGGLWESPGDDRSTSVRSLPISPWIPSAPHPERRHWILQSRNEFVF
jgi:hypothetical protein